MKVSRLIADIGDDNVGLQVLSKCFRSAKRGQRKPRRTTITFSVDDCGFLDGTQEALIVWVPKATLNEVAARIEAECTCDPSAATHEAVCPVVGPPKQAVAEAAGGDRG